MVSAAQVILRVLATGLTIGASYLIFTSKQHVEVDGFSIDASWRYSSAFEFFAYGNAVACGLSLLFLVSAALCGHYFFMVVHDLVLTAVLIAACGAATAVGFIGKYGNDHTGWSKICDQFGKFCNRVTIAVACSYGAVLVYLILTILSANKSRRNSF